MVEVRKKTRSRETSSITQCTLLDDEITEVIFFQNFHYLSTCPHFFEKEMKGTIDRRKIEHQRELARMMHRKQIEEGHGQFKKAPTQVLKHAGTFLDHEIKTKLKF